MNAIIVPAYKGPEHTEQWEIDLSGGKKSGPVGGGDKPAASGDPHSPWEMRDGWRLDGAVALEIGWREGDSERVVSVRDGDIAMPRVADDIDVVRIANRFTIIDGNGSWRLDYVDPWADRADVAAAVGRLTAPMPGKIVQVLAQAGDTVKRGQPVLILEAMKMEHTIAAPADGIVDAINYAVGDLVEEGAALIGFTPAGG